MSGATNYLQKKWLDSLLGLATFTIPATLYLSLHLTSPTDSGSYAGEVPLTGAGYSRQLITGSMSLSDLTTRLTTSTAVFNFGPAVIDWGTISFIGIGDAATAGNMLFWGMPTLPKTISAGTPFQLPAGQVNIRFL